MALWIWVLIAAVIVLFVLPWLVKWRRRALQPTFAEYQRIDERFVDPVARSLGLSKKTRFGEVDYEGKIDGLRVSVSLIPSGELSISVAHPGPLPMPFYLAIEGPEQVPWDDDLVVAEVPLCSYPVRIRGGLPAGYLAQTEPEWQGRVVRLIQRHLGPALRDIADWEEPIYIDHRLLAGDVRISPAADFGGSEIRGREHLHYYETFLRECGAGRLGPRVRALVAFEQRFLKAIEAEARAPAPDEADWSGLELEDGD